MKLIELCRGLSVSISYGKDVRPQDINITDITVDSRSAGGASVFAPVLGHRINGADFVGDAYNRGCRVFLSETDTEPKADCVIIKTKNIRKSVAEMSIKINGCDFKRLRIIGVTGTKGKTTIALTIAKILGMADIKAFSIGTLGLCDADGNIIRKTKNTTPEATELFGLMRMCDNMGADAVVLEVSSQAIMDYRIYGLEFFAVIFSSLGIDHIGEFEHENFTQYARAKRSLFTDYKSEYRILSADDVYTPFVAFGTEKCIKCGFSENSDFRITEFSQSPEGSLFRLNGVRVNSKMPAKYDAVNVALAIAAAEKLSGKKVTELASYIPCVKIPGRFERHTVNGRHFVIDYAHNKISFISVLSLAKKIFSGRIISVFGSVGERSKGRRRELAQAAENYSDYSIITSDNPGFEPPYDICREIMMGFSDKKICEICVSREAAILRAYELSNEGDVIMLLGKGHEEEMDIGGRKIPFSEREVIRKLQNL